MQFLFEFPDITKIADFWQKKWCQQNSRVVEKALYNFGSSLGKVQLYKFHYCGICVTDFEKGMEPMPPIHEQPWKGPGNLEISTLLNKRKTVRKNVIHLRYIVHFYQITKKLSISTNTY